MIDFNEYETKMNKSIEVLKREFNGLRTGRHQFLCLTQYILRLTEVMRR